MDLLNGFWSEQFWLPKNATWPDIDRYRTLDLDHLFTYPFGAGVVLYLIRLVFERQAKRRREWLGS